jgi:hypothetical protein
MCENETSISIDDLRECIGVLDEYQLTRVAYACVMQKPFLAYANKVTESDTYKMLVNY